ncbi:MAG: 4-hydroxybenzoate 3-monooxygenase [Trueperaceae bacterium]
MVYQRGEEHHELRCDFVAGCDGFHGIAREAVPAGVLRVFERVYPFGWLGVLAEAEPSSHELIYANHERGFALHSMRSPTLSRNYVQVDPDDALAAWPDERFWDEFQRRMATTEGFHANEGPVVEKSITAMRSFVVEPMQYGRLFLAGDAAHIVPPTGAKGMNLAVRDVVVLADALVEHYRRRSDDALTAYTDACLRHVWRAQHFSWWMTAMFHRTPDDNEYGRRLQHAQLAHVCGSEAAARSLAENYVGYDEDVVWARDVRP